MAEVPPTSGERAEAARVRRRWLNLGEVVAIVAVLISGLTLWNSYRERANNEAAHAQENAQSAHKAATLILRATADKDGKRLTLAPYAGEQAIQSQTIHFPSALALSAADTSSDARIERAWFEGAVVAARKAAGIEDQPGDARLPVLIETHFLADGDPHSDRALYEIGYSRTHSLLGGTELHLRGLSRTGAVADIASGQKRLDAIWAARIKAKRP